MGWWDNILIKDYQPYFRTKERVFQQLVRDRITVNKWLPPDPLSGGRLPFVGFAGFFAAITEIPFNLSDNILLHFWKENGIIYCKKGMSSAAGAAAAGAGGDAHRPSRPPVAPPRSGTTNAEFKRNKVTHMQMNFTRRLLQQDPESPSKKMSEEEKYFKVSKCMLGKHTIVSFSEVNAVDNDGRDVKILLSSWNNHKKSQLEKEKLICSRFLELWSHARLVHQEKMIMGMTDPYTHNLNDIRIFDADTKSICDVLKSLLVVTDPNWDPAAACHFMDRMLTYVQAILSNMSDFRVLTFRFRRNDSHMNPKIESDQDSDNIRTDRKYLRI
jgi:hypothetical protein